MDKLYMELKAGSGVELREVASNLNVDIDHATKKLDISILETEEFPVRISRIG